MERRRSYFAKESVLFLVVILLFAGFAIAVVIKAGDGSTDFGTINEQITNRYNVSVNNTDIANNITQVNITLPSGFTFGLGTNYTLATTSFSNTTTILIWEGNATIANGSNVQQFFVFNTTANTSMIGNYNFTIVAMNASGGLTTQNISVTINDTSVPSSVSYASSTYAHYSNKSQTTIAVNITVIDNGGGGTVRLHIYNSTHDILNSSNVSVGGSGGSAFFNFTGLTVDGLYYVNLSVNDTNNNINTTGPGTRIFVLDNSNPSVSVALTTAEKTTLTMAITKSDATSGLTSTCSVTGGVSPSISGTVLSDTGLSCGTQYTYIVTCSDHAGNNGQGTLAQETSTCTSSGGSGSDWTNTYTHDDDDLENKGSVSRDLGSKQRMKVKVSGETHYVGVKSLGAGSAVIEIASDPQSFTFNIGDVRKFDFDADGFYDMSVTLESIASSKAKVILLSIHEAISEAEEQAKEESKIEEGAGETPEVTESEGLSTGYLVGVIVVILIIIGVVFYFKRRK